MENVSKKKRRLKRNVKFFIFELIFIILIIISSIKIINWVNDNNKNKKALDTATKYIKIEKDKEDEKYSIDFKGLKKENSDTVAWIQVNGTNINYPVTHTTNNDFYLNHDVNKNLKLSGWVFMDYRNAGDLSDDNSIF